MTTAKNIAISTAINTEDQHRLILENLKSDPGVRKLLHKYSEVHPAIQISAIGLDWSVILGVSAASIYMNSVVVYLVSVFLIASRQHALLVMMHDAAHFRISKNRKVNDSISDWLCAYPTLMTTQFYRIHHLKHHQFTNTDLDPDWARKRDLNEWQFPKTKNQLVLALAKSFLTGGLDWMRLTLTITKGDWRKIGFWLSVILIFVFAGQATNLFLYWFVPLLTVFPLLQRIRSIAEHFGIERTSALTGSRDVKLNWLVSYLFAPHHVHWHLTHHLFPTIPQYRLKEFHKCLNSDAAFRAVAQLNDGYFSGPESTANDLLSETQKQKISA